jgi:hypothetical protein
VIGLVLGLIGLVGGLLIAGLVLAELALPLIILFAIIF